MNSTQYSSYDLERQRQRLESLVQPQAKSPILALVQTWGMALVTFLTADHSPRIRQRQYQGRPVWTVYDPLTEQHHRFDSEAEVMTWLEQGYR